MDSNLSPMTFMKTMHKKGISQKLGVRMLRIILRSKDDLKVIEQLTQIVQNSKTEKEIAEKIQPLKEKYKVA